MMAYNSPSNGGYSGDERGESPRSNDLDDSQFDGDMSDKPVYLLEHLATFTVNKESGILYPADGMRKLLQLEKTTGIWSQKMQLCLDRQWVLIMDYETGNIIERFPATLIQEPTAFTSNDPIEMYNNILVFIVGGEASARSEMHIFQCQSISAIHLVEDLKALRSGKLITKYRDPLPSSSKPLATSSSHNSPKISMIRSERHAVDDTDSELGVNDETSSTSSEKYERDVTVLNHCFDDIEKFIARLQHAAAASRELERRRRSRRSKKKDPGEGLLTLRTRPPHEKEFIDIFAKFKLSFNLLAKLKSHIHDPNAPELVHFLFTPLALIVDASHDTCYDPNLPARVVEPLPTRDAINLLHNCVTSKEMELLRSLGDAWMIPRDKWKGQYGANYHPVFFDGWSPDYPVIDELEAKSRRLDYNDFEEFEQPAVTKTGLQTVASTGSPVFKDFSARSEISIDSIERNGGATVVDRAPSGSGIDPQTEAWLEELHARDAKIVQVTYPRTANNDKELTVVRGEFLEVLDDTRKWWKARNVRGRTAHVPHTIVTTYSYPDGRDDMYGGPQSSGYKREESSPATPNVMPAEWVRNKHVGRYTSHQSDQSSYDGDMYTNNNHQPYHQSTNVNRNSSVLYSTAALRPISRTDENNNTKKPPVPPPLPPTTPTTPYATLRSINSERDFERQQSTASRKSTQDQQVDDMQEELKNVLALFRDRRKHLEIHKTPDVFITQTSNPAEIEKWLRAKGFEERTVKKLHGLSGNELFGLKKHTLEDYFGIEEGRRLASQITIQKNVSGYKTARSSELMAILAKARQKTEQPNDRQSIGNEVF
ncbi:unnamed protein product [Chironomus riparius]|uniref:SH3 domain-containing protein n=1 Tax=Chironomus riparius TaxID=315576 RepID=A0A9N9WXT9_9DIPT|nr:unnamed protein product [Chironomus riparius]